MKQLKVTVKTESPIVLTTESNATVMTGTHDVVSGSILRGVLAAQYIDACGLGKKAHQNEEFRRLFFGALRFTDANIACPDDDKRSFAIPLSMQKEKAKAGQTEAGQTEAVEDLMRVDSPKKGMKSFGGYAVLTDDNLIKTVSAAKDVSLHMSRASEEERKKGRSEDGGIYNYESIDARQTFIGWVIGEDADISALRAHVASEFKCRVGRSKFTQYGRCSVKFGELEDVPALIAADLENGSVILRLDSPLLFDGADEPQPNEAGQGKIVTAPKALGLIVRALNARTGSNAFSLGKVFAAGAEIENYVGVWGMKRPREQALAAGTVFSVGKDGDWTEQDFDALTDVMYRGVGRRTEEGFGQLRHWPIVTGKWTKPKTSGNKEPAPLLFKKASEETAKIARKAFERRLAEQIRLYAAEDAKNAKYDRALYNSKEEGLSGLTHFFSRLDHLLDAEQNARGADGRKQGKTEGLRESYRKTLKAVVRPPMENNLRKVCIAASGRSLYDMLLENSELPVSGRRWMEDVGTKEARTKAFMDVVGLEENMFDLTDGQYFYEYWHSFFRSARKRAVTKQEEAESDA